MKCDSWVLTEEEAAAMSTSASGANPAQVRALDASTAAVGPASAAVSPTASGHEVCDSIALGG